MSNVGPICHIPPTSEVGNPQPHNVPGIPRAPDPASPSFNNDVAAFLQAMFNTLQTLLTNIAQNNVNSARSGGLQEIPGSRVTSKVKIYQNNDPRTGNFVEVEQINRLSFKDGRTGETWSWKR